MMKIKHTIIAAIFLFAMLASCEGKRSYEISEISVSRILIDSTHDSAQPTQLGALIDSFRREMTALTSVEIGFSTQDLVKGKPQSLLGNFTADAMLEYALEKWNKGDFAITNTGGIRGTLNKGPITVGELYEIYPFENQIVLLGIKGNDVEKLFNALAPKSGEVVSGTVEYVIKDKKTESLKIGGKPVDRNRIYYIVTVDYLAEGNDGMTALTNAESTEESGILIRDLMINHIKKLSAAGKPVESKLDKRIKIK